MDMKQLEAQLARDEGRAVRRYKDTRGHWTIGIGHNLDVSPLPASWREPLTGEQVDTLFFRDIKSTIENLDTRLSWWRAKPEPIGLALADMGFNMGVGQWGVSGLLEFTTFLNLIHDGRYVTAAQDLAGSLWHRQVQTRALRIEAQIRSAVTV